VVDPAGLLNSDNEAQKHILLKRCSLSLLTA